MRALLYHRLKLYDRCLARRSIMTRWVRARTRQTGVSLVGLQVARESQQKRQKTDFKRDARCCVYEPLSFNTDLEPEPSADAKASSAPLGSRLPRHWPRQVSQCVCHFLIFPFPPLKSLHVLLKNTCVEGIRRLSLNSLEDFK